MVLTASETHADGSVAASRFVDEHDVAWTPIPLGPFEEPVSVREATATWRRTLADLDVPAATTPGRARRAGRARRGSGTLVVPARWTDTGAPLHETIRVSYSKLSTLENCELQYVLSAELGLGGMVGYHAWVGKTVHKIIEDCENGTVGRSLDRDGGGRRRPLATAGVPVHGGLRDVEAPGQGDDAAELVRQVRRAPRDRHGARVRVRVRRRDAERLHRPDRARPARVRHAHHRLQDRRHVRGTRRRTRACSWASTTWPRRRRRT